MKRPEDEGASGMPSTQGGSVVKLRLANLRRICNGSMHRANGEPFTDAELTNGLREMSQRAMAAGLVIPAHHGKEAAAAASAADILHTAYSSQTPCRGTNAKAPAPAPPLCASATGQRAAGSSAGTRGLEPNVLGAEPRVPAGVKLLNRIAKWFLPRLGPPRSARSWLPQLSVRSGTAENILPGKDELDVAAYLAASGSPPTDVAEWQGRAAVPVSTRPVTPPPLSVRDAELCDGIAASKKTIETLISTEIAAAPLATPLTTTGCPEQSEQTPEKREDMVLPGPADDSSVAVDSAKPTALSSDGKTGVTAPAPLPEIAAARLATAVALAGCPEQSEHTPEKGEDMVLPGPADDSSVAVDSAKPTALSSDGKTGVTAPAPLPEIAAARLATAVALAGCPEQSEQTPEKREEVVLPGLADDSSVAVDSRDSAKPTALSPDGKTGVTALAPLPEIAAARLATAVALARCPEQSEHTPEKGEEMVLPGPADDSSVGVDGRRPASAKPMALSSDGKTDVTAPAPLPEIAAARLATDVALAGCPEQSEQTPEKREEVVLPGPADDSSVGVDGRRPASAKPTALSSDGKTGVAAPASLSEIAAARLVTPSTPTPRPQPVVRTPEKCEELAATAFCQVWDRRTEVVRKRRAGLADDSSAGVDSPASNKATSTASKHPCSMTIKEGGRTVKIAGSKAHVKMMGTYVEIEERFSRHQSFVKVGKKGAHPYFLFYLSKGWQIAKQLGSEKGCISTTSSSVRPDKARSIWHEARGAEGPKGMVCNPTIACTLVAGGAPRKHESPSHMSPTPIWVAHAATTLHVSAMQQDNGKLRGGRTAVQRALFRPTAR